MPAGSIAQRKFFAIMEHHPEEARAKRINMTKSQMHDFASTPEKGLPYRKKPAKAGRLAAFQAYASHRG